MKKLSFILMSMLMILAVSCSKSSESSENKEKDAATLVKDCNAAYDKLAQDPSDANYSAAADVYFESFEALMKEDNAELLAAVAKLDKALEDNISVASDGTKNKVGEKVKALQADEKAQGVIEKIQAALKGAAQAQQTQPAQSSYDFDEPAGYEEISEMIEEIPMPEEAEPALAE